jgi:hypothetical protein
MDQEELEYITGVQYRGRDRREAYILYDTYPGHFFLSFTGPKAFYPSIQESRENRTIPLLERGWPDNVKYNRGSYLSL